MRQTIAPLLWLLLLSAQPGCNPDPCNPGSLFLSLTFDGATRAADQVVVTVTVDEVPKSYSKARTAGRGSDSVEIDFTSYTAGQAVTVEVTALAGGGLLGSGRVDVMLDAGCSARTLAITSGGPGDDAGVDGGDGDADGGDLGPGDDGAAPDQGKVTQLAGELGGPGSADGVGTQARFNTPHGMALDSAGDLYVADFENHVLRKVAPGTGEVTLFVGAPGQIGSANGIGTAARFDHPSGVASDGAGKLYVTDSDNSTIREVVVATREVTTLFGFAGQTGSANGMGNSARFNHPEGIAFKDDKLYVCDRGNHTIRVADLATLNVTTLAGAAGVSGSADSTDGTGATATFNYPASIVVVGADLYLTDEENHLVRKVAIGTGATSSVAGLAGQAGDQPGVGTAARFYHPHGLASDGTGNLYIADSDTHTIRQLVLSSSNVTTIAGAGFVYGSDNGAATAARFNRPYGLAIDGGKLYISELSDVRLLQLDTKQVSTLAGSPQHFGNTQGMTGALLNQPWAIATSATGDLYIADANNDAIRKLTSAGELSVVAGNGRGAMNGGLSVAQFAHPQGVAVDGRVVYVADTDNNTIRKIDLDKGEVSTIAGVAGMKGSSDDGLGLFDIPIGLAVDAAGDLFIANYGGCTIRKVAKADGAVSTLAGTAGLCDSAEGTGDAARFDHPIALVSDGAGNLYVGDSLNHTIRKIETATRTVTTFAGGIRTPGDTNGKGTAARFFVPRAIAFTSDALYVGDDNMLVRRVALPGGEVTTVAGQSGQAGVITGPLPGRLNTMGGIAVFGGGLAVSITAENSILGLPR